MVTGGGMVTLVTGGGWAPPHPAAGAGVGVSAAPHTEIHPTLPHKLATSPSVFNILLVWISIVSKFYLLLFRCMCRCRRLCDCLDDRADVLVAARHHHRVRGVEALSVVHLQVIVVTPGQVGLLHLLLLLGSPAPPGCSQGPRAAPLCCWPGTGCTGPLSRRGGGGGPQHAGVHCFD